MATFKIEWLDNKSPDWKVASLKDGTGVIHTEVSINKVNKKGEAFPNFDAITLAQDIEGELWVSSAGKKYLFAPRPTTAPKSNGAYKTHKMEEMASDKRAFVRETMDAKEEAIRVASCNNQGNAAAISIFEAEMRLHPHSDPAALWKKLWDDCRNHMWMHWDEVRTDNPPTGI